MKFEIKKKIIKPLCIYSLAFSMLLPSVASLADLDINLGGYSVVYAAEIPAPTVTKAFIGTKTISGGNVHVDRVNKKVIRGTVHVTLKDKDGVVKADNLTFTPKSGKNWTVNLPEGVTIAEGDTVTAYQEFDGQQSPATTANAMDSLAKQNKDKLKMPSGEIWIEQTSSNQVNEDEQAEAVQMLKDANTAIAGDIKSVKFSIDGTEHAYYEVTYTDGSTSGQVEATNLKIKPVTEYSRGATLGSITIVDNVIKGQLSGEGPFDGIKVQILLKLSDAVKDSYCDKGKCLTDKDTSDPVDATVNGTTGEFTYTIPNPDLKLNQLVGVTVKEPHKFKSCSKTPVKPVVVGKTEVKDPRKLTAKDKKAIDAAIRKAYTVNGESKLPNGTGFNEGAPAVIQIDDSGNVKIFSGNDVVVNEWDDNGKAIPEKNEDGSVKLKDGAQPKITIPAKDLLKNIKPDAPAVELSKDNKSITITPNEKDTDANSISVSYTGKDGSTKTTKATKDDNGTWSISEGEGSVDANGVVTLPKDKVKGDTTVTATVTDKGGIADDDKTPLISDPGSKKILSKAEQIKELGGLDPVDIKKWVGDKLDWKEGVKAKDSATAENKSKIDALLAEEGTTFVDATRNTSAEGDFNGTIKVTFDDGSFIEVENQNLYVSNHVTSMDRKDKVPTDALDVEFKLGEGTKVDNTDGTAIEGNKDNPVSYQKYMVKPKTNLKEYKNETLNETYYNLINSKVKAIDKYTEPVWNNGEGSVTEDFVITETNKVFTAKATKTFKVTLDPNGGGGTKSEETKKSGEKYTLPKGDTYTPPDDKQEFKTWEVEGKEVAPGTEITVEKDTVVKAIWKDIEYKVSFDGNTGTGSMDTATVKKGEKYKLPDNTFGTPQDKQGFKTWEIDGKEVAPGTEITVEKDTVVKAVWKDKATTPGEEPGTTPEPNPNEPGEDDFYIPEFRIHKDYTPTYPVYVTVPKTEKIEKVPEALEIHKAYIAGYEDNTLRAEGNITRAEAAAMVTRLAGLDLSDNSMPAFKDMQKNAWYFRYINAAVKANMLDADNGMMRPNDKITRAEFAKMLAAIDKENSSVSKFEDIKGHRYEKEINKIYGNNRIEGYEDGSFRPDANLTRAESAAFLNRMFNRIADKEAYAGLEDKLAKFKDFDSSKWYYDEMVEATNSHELTRRGTASDKYERVYEKWTRVLGSDVR